LGRSTQQGKPLGRPRDGDVPKGILFLAPACPEVPVVDKHGVEGRSLGPVDGPGAGVVDPRERLAEIEESFPLRPVFFGLFSTSLQGFLVALLFVFVENVDRLLPASAERLDFQGPGFPLALVGGREGADLSLKVLTSAFRTRTSSLLISFGGPASYHVSVPTSHSFATSHSPSTNRSAPVPSRRWRLSLL
jgi:hypothetical protein